MFERKKKAVWMRHLIGGPFCVCVCVFVCVCVCLCVCTCVYVCVKSTSYLLQGQVCVRAN